MDYWLANYYRLFALYGMICQLVPSPTNHPTNNCISWIWMRKKKGLQKGWGKVDWKALAKFKNLEKFWWLGEKQTCCIWMVKNQDLPQSIFWQLSKNRLTVLFGRIIMARIDMELPGKLIGYGNPGIGKIGVRGWIEKKTLI